MPHAALAKALKTRPGSYLTPDIAHIKPGEALLTGMDYESVTNATSKRPVIGTHAFVPCTVIILYNKRTKTAALLHKTDPQPEDITRLVGKVRGEGADLLQAHVIGCGALTEGEMKPEHEIRLETIVDSLQSHPNIVIKTFDVLDKPKPHAVAIDTASGNLIRGSALFKTQAAAEKDAVAPSPPDFFATSTYLFGDWAGHEGQHYDGTLKENQKGKTFP